MSKEIKISKYKAKRKKKTYLCNYICYNSLSTYLACSFQEEDQEDESENRGDGEIMIYSLIRNEITWEVSRDFDLASIKGMEFHPRYPNILLTADANGKIILLDIH